MDLSRRARVLLGQVDQLAETLARSLWERVPGYEFTALDRVELLDAIRASVRCLLSCLAEDRDPTDEELDPARVLGERRAIQGVPIESMIGSWHSAERVFCEWLLAGGDELTAADARETSRRVATLIDRMADVATDAYRSVRGEAQAQFSQASADILSSLVGEKPLESEEVERRARLIGVEPDRPHRVVAFGSPGADGIALTKFRRSVAEVLRPHVPGRMLAGSHQGYELLLLAEPDDLIGILSRALSQRAGGRISLGLGEPRPRMVEVSGSVSEAISALRLALRLERPIARFVDVVPEVLLQENPHAMRTMVQAVLGPIDHGDLIETLRGFLACGLSIRATSRQLHVHENTVAYRIKRILQAFDLDSADGLVRPDILLSLRARELEERCD